MELINLLGIQFDANSSFMRGPGQAPPLIRKALHSDSSNYYNERGQNVLDYLSDHGDLPPSTPYDQLSTAVAGFYTPFEKWVFLGGDHSITYPIMQVVGQHYPRLSILHLDAHSDLYDELDGNRFSHACPFARIMEDGLAQRLTQVGIRTLNAHQRVQAEKFEVTIIQMNKWSADTMINLEGPVYLSLDIDVLDPAFAPGISHYEPGGASTRQVIDFLHRHNHLDIVAADIVEYNPLRDVNDMTAFAAAKFLKELVSAMSEK